MRFLRQSLPGAVALLLVLLAVASASSLWDRDEPRFAAAGREMAASGNLLTPTFNGELRARKPVLSTWLMALSIRVLGPTEIAARIWSALALVATALLTARLGGTLAFLVLAATPLALVEGTAATADALLLAFVTAALAVHAQTLVTGHRARHVLLMGLALGLAQLTKGPIGLVLPLVAIGAASLLARDGPPSRGPLLAASLLSLALFAAWAIPANLTTGGRYVASGFGHEVMDRVVTPLEGHGGPFLVSLPYYLPVLLLGFSPWTLYLPAALGLLVRRRREPRAALLLAWIAAPFAVFTAVATKLPHYVLPAWPALAVAVADAVERAQAGDVPPSWLRHGARLFATVQLVVLLGLVSVAILTPLHAPFLVFALCLAATSAAGLLLHRRQRHLDAVRLLGTASLLGMATAALWLLPHAEALKPVPRLAARIREATAPTVPVATFEFAEPSLDFYVGRPPIARLASETEALAWLAVRAPGVMVVPSTTLLRIAPAAAPHRELAVERGFNVAKGTWVELVAVLRGP